MKVVTILGTRPEIIKLSPLLPLLDEEFEHILIHTGQHYDYELDGVFFKDLNLQEPRYSLHIGSFPQGKQIGLMLEKIEEILIKEAPDLVLVHGDTNTTLAGSLAATKLHIPLAHVEAGCRSFNKKMPEEINRILSDHAADYLFAADKESQQNLAREGLSGKNVFMVGNTIFDACLRNVKPVQESEILKELHLEKGKYVLVTIHRQQSTDSKEVLQNIISALDELSNMVDVVFPMHPRTKKALEKNNIQISEKIKVTKPLQYLPFLKLLSDCRFCISDSGGIQDEALVFNVPCLIPRHDTEWTRLVTAGKNFLVGDTKESIIAKAEELVKNDHALQEIKNIKYNYDTGVGEKIVKIIKEEFQR